MTNESLTKANEIRSSISSLNQALSSVARVRIFDSNSCYPGMVYISSLLNELESSAKMALNEKIMDRIRELEYEFDQL